MPALCHLDQTLYLNSQEIPEIHSIKLNGSAAARLFARHSKANYLIQLKWPECHHEPCKYTGVNQDDLVEVGAEA